MSPISELAEASGGPILCATHRLVKRLRERHDAAQQAQGLVSWLPLDALTLDAWLARISDAALLAGAVDAGRAPRLALSAWQERLLWERVIGTEAATTGEDALFDREGLAAAAAEANDLVEVWNLPGDGAAGEETARFLAWRRKFRSLCARNGWLEAARWRAWQLEAVKAVGATAATAATEAMSGALPSQLTFAGFDNYNPQETRLIKLLAERGVRVQELRLGAAVPAPAQVLPLADRSSECRAAAAWVAERLRENLHAHLGLVTPQLSALRPALAAALDDVLHPESLLPGRAEEPRCYNFSLGSPLAEQPVVAAALRLLALAGKASTAANLAQMEVSELLTGAGLGAYWSAGLSEADGRARLDAAWRGSLPPECRLGDLLRVARRHAGFSIPQCLRHLAAMQSVAHSVAHSVIPTGESRLPSDWRVRLPDMLQQMGWPGERPLSSHEWQAIQAFQTSLTTLDGLDSIVGRVRFGEVVRLVTRLCRELVFQPETERAPALEVLGPLEAAGAGFDALWLLGMNDDVWPPPARPNPLLPAEWQRRAKATNASAEVQLSFARSVQQRLLHSAPLVICSYAEAEGDRPMRASPLLAGMARLAAGEGPAAITGPLQARVGRASLESLLDDKAPPLPEGSLVKGGTGILSAQAICPAWAFYRYRLGAQALPEPVAGLNAAERGSILHQAMDNLWAKHDSKSMAALSEAKRNALVSAVAAASMDSFQARREVPLPPRYAALEGEYLAQLIYEWLAMELRRDQAFAVVAREQRSQLNIAGLAVNVRVDRLDVLEDGRLLLLDYKTAERLTTNMWQGDRIVEPQLPAYAAWGMEDAPAGVAFARVRLDQCGFIGLSEAKDLLPGLKAPDDWQQTLKEWREAIANVANEILAGEAGVWFEDEQALAYCEVLPLLRLAERRERDLS